MKKLINFLILCTITTSCSFSKYQESKLDKIPTELDTSYSIEALTYLALVDATLAEQEANINQEKKLLEFPNHQIKVLIIYDKTQNLQTVNIVALQNGFDIKKATFQAMITAKLFTFPINRYYNYIYNNIREDILKSLNEKMFTRINTLGSASVYANLLAIELSGLNVPIDNITQFGPVRFTTQEHHNSIANTFGPRMISFTHEKDISHRILMKKSYATDIPSNFAVCTYKNKCSNAIYPHKNFSKSFINTHPSNYPELHADLYYQSFLQITKP